MEVYRKAAVPAIFTQIGFVRATSPHLLCDCDDDLPLLQQLQRIANGLECISELESSHVFIVKAELPDDILSRDGSSGEVIEWRVYQWKFWDVESLVENRLPTEAIRLIDAGITSEFIESLADPVSCLPMLRDTEDLLDSEERKGYELNSETEDAIKAIEKPLIARLKIAAKKKKLKRTVKPTAPKATSSPQVSPKLREVILRRDNYRCIFCGSTSQEANMEVNHIIPKSLIKKLNLDEALFTIQENLCTTCRSCNRSKSDTLAVEDIEYYCTTFSDAEHSNHNLLGYLTRISELQSLSKN